MVDVFNTKLRVIPKISTLLHIFQKGETPKLQKMRVHSNIGKFHAIVVMPAMWHVNMLPCVSSSAYLIYIHFIEHI